MIISDEQALLAARYLSAPSPEYAHASLGAVSDDTLAAARAVVEQLPETRDDRVIEARAFLHSPEFTSREIASKMISRIISDSLR